MPDLWKTIQIVLSLAFVMNAASASSQGAERRPNVLLINVDDMGYNDLGCYGAKDSAIKTPNIDRLAGEGVRFTNYLSACSVCTPEEWASLQRLKGRMNPRTLPAMVRELDHHVGLVLRAIKELDIERETLVVFASDNGPWLPAGSAHPLSGGKYTTMEGGHRVPAFIRWPEATTHA